MGFNELIQKGFNEGHFKNAGLFIAKGVTRLDGKNPTWWKTEEEQTEFFDWCKTNDIDTTKFSFSSLDETFKKFKTQKNNA